ncbi:MAG: hypothetical protein KDB00_09855 [Planctomycetales bacterium]|nr:hypothetical protein [Planctomycetales bacterium]
MEFQPSVALPTWIFLAVLFLVTWAAYGYRSRNRIGSGRRIGVMLLMLLVGCVPLALLLNPVWVDPVAPPEGKPLVTILVDTSASMSVNDDGNDATRIDQATSLAKTLVDRFGPTYEHQIISFAGESSGLDLTSTPVADGSSTDVAAALTSAAQNDRPRGQAIVLMSDGIHNVGAAGRAIQAARLARGQAAPVFPIKFGGPQTVRNVSISVKNVNRIAFVGASFRLSATAKTVGFRNVPIEVAWQGESIEDDSRNQSILVDSQTDVEVVASASVDKPGLYRYRVTATGIPGEATSVDNQASVLVRVLDHPIGVLLLEGKPYWDSKFLARNLAIDPSIELESLVMMRSDRYLHRRQYSPPANRSSNEVAANEVAADEVAADESTAQSSQTGDNQQPSWQVLSSPQEVIGSAQALQKYQVIVLGRDAESFLDVETVDRLRDWVAREGGSLVCARGTPQSDLSEKLGRMLPVRWSPQSEQRVRATATDVAQQEGWWSDDDSIDRLSALPSLVTGQKPELRGGLPRVLVAGQDKMPLLTYQPFGGGRTVVVEGAGMWRWALLPPDYSASDETYAQVWNGLLHWLVSRVSLAPGTNRSLQSDRSVFNSETPAAATLLIRDFRSGDPIPTVRLEQVDVDSAPVDVVCEPAGDQPGVLRARFGKLAAGHYRATLVGADPADRSVTGFEVREPTAERLELSPREDILLEIASESGGQMLNANDADAIVARIDQQITNGLPIETRQTAAWDRWWVMVAIIGLWTTTWVLRRGNGLI